MNLMMLLLLLVLFGTVPAIFLAYEFGEKIIKRYNEIDRLSYEISVEGMMILTIHAIDADNHNALNRVITRREELIAEYNAKKFWWMFKK